MIWLLVLFPFLIFFIALFAPLLEVKITKFKIEIIPWREYPNVKVRNWATQTVQEPPNDWAEEA